MNIDLLYAARSSAGIHRRAELALANAPLEIRRAAGLSATGGWQGGQTAPAKPPQRRRYVGWLARVGEEFLLECPACGGDIRLIAFITEPGPIRKILTHLGEPLEPPPVSPARGPPIDWGELVQAHDDRDVFQAAPDELPVIDIHSV